MTTFYLVTETTGYSAPARRGIPLPTVVWFYFGTQAEELLWRQYAVHLSHWWQRLLWYSSLRRRGTSCLLCLFLFIYTWTFPHKVF